MKSAAVGSNGPEQQLAFSVAFKHKQLRAHFEGSGKGDKIKSASTDCSGELFNEAEILRNKFRGGKLHVYVQCLTEPNIDTQIQGDTFCGSTRNLLSGTN